MRLRNELTQKSIAKECAEWIRQKAVFKSTVSHEYIDNFLIVEDGDKSYVYSPMRSFTTVDLGLEKGKNITNLVNRVDAPDSQDYIDSFNEIWDDNEKLNDVTEDVIDMISNVYKENPPELIYYMTLYNIFSEFLNDISEDNLPNEDTGFKDSIIWNKLYNFQKDAAYGIINKLEKYNGCILADSVGLGKTFTALAVIKYYEERNKNVLVLCPKKLSENWLTYRNNLINNPLAKDRLRYDVLYHTDLSRERGMSATGIPLEKLNWSNYDLVVIDESHNFRNGNGTDSHNGEKENRYMRLMNRVLLPGVKTKVLMLSATPVNNRFNDLKNQLALAYCGNPEGFNKKLDTKSDIDTIFRNAQRVYNSWVKLPDKDRTTENLMSRLDLDFFELLDSVTIARSRKHIENYYDTTEIGTFPKRNKPISLRPSLTFDKNGINYKDVYAILDKLKLTVYTPSSFILKSRLLKYTDDDWAMVSGREQGIKRLMNINLLKRMESSVQSFYLTVQRVRDYLKINDKKINEFIKKKSKCTISDTDFSKMALDFDEDDQNTDYFTVGKNVKIDLDDMDYILWQHDIESDIAHLNELIALIEDITPENDFKLQKLFKIIKEKEDKPINPGNKKILIFTAFADTADYLYENVSTFAKEKLGLETALVTGSTEGKSTIDSIHSDMNEVLTFFSPKSKERDLIYKNRNEDIDILIATDCISEGQNLQDCDYCINYDIHWNPVRIIQRFGRIDRIGSTNSVIQLVNFWPDIDLDEYINLKARVESRMKISVISSTATGSDDPINSDEGDLSYRKEQLKRLHEEVVDLEDMNSGVSITDLGLNDFRMDLINYAKTNPSIDHVPLGIHAVVKGENSGVIFVLKNVNENINIDKKNRLHPFYLVYVGEDGQVLVNHLNPKQTLDTMRFLSRGKNNPDEELCKAFNKRTKGGHDMGKVSKLLEDAIDSIIEKKEEEDVESFFSGENTTFLSEGLSGLNDFELISFLVVM